MRGNIPSSKAPRSRATPHTLCHATDCTLCDNEQKNFPDCAAYSAPAPNGGICGFHFSPSGWEVLVNNTVRALRGALAERAAAAARGQ